MFRGAPSIGLERGMLEGFREQEVCWAISKVFGRKFLGLTYKVGLAKLERLRRGRAQMAFHGKVVFP
jgi:hypothetical protein